MRAYLRRRRNVAATALAAMSRNSGSGNDDNVERKKNASPNFYLIFFNTKLDSPITIFYYYFLFLLNLILLPEMGVVCVLAHAWTRVYHLFCTISGGTTILGFQALIFVLWLYELELWKWIFYFYISLPSSFYCWID